MKGWSIVGDDDLLGMGVISEPASLLLGTVPAPKVIQNQLDHLLERHIFETEEKLLKQLYNLIRRQDRGKWIIVFLSLIIILHVLERDTGRLVYWAHHKEDANTWRHPLKPIQLIEKSVYLSNLPVAHSYYAAAGSLPLGLDRSSCATTKQLVNNDSAVVCSMQALQSHIRNLRLDERLGQKRRVRYGEKSGSSSFIRETRNTGAAMPDRSCMPSIPHLATTPQKIISGRSDSPNSDGWLAEAMIDLDYVECVF